MFNFKVNFLKSFTQKIKNKFIKKFHSLDLIAKHVHSVIPKILEKSLLFVNKMIYFD